MKIKDRLLLTHGLLIILALVIVMTNAIAYRDMRYDSDNVNNLGKLRALSYDIGRISTQVLMSEDEMKSEALLSNLKDRIDEFEDILNLHISKGLKHRTTMDNLKKIQEEWDEGFKNIYGEIIEGKATREDCILLNENLTPFVKEINSLVKDYSEIADKKVYTALRANAVLVIILVITAAYSLTSINRKIRKPIGILMKQLKELSITDDEIVEELDRIQMDEIGEIEQFFNILVYDQLTKVYNRRAGLSKLNKIVSAEEKRRFKMSLCFIDINGLKQVNDIFGHEKGDELIISTADCIKNTIREEDFIIRMGGDEFLIAFEGIGREEAEKVWTRIKRCYEIINETNNRPYLISVSHGIVEYDSTSNQELEDMIKTADERMYEEKRYIKEVKKIKVIRDEK